MDFIQEFWPDILMVGVLTYYAFDGYKRGFVPMLFESGGFIISFLVALFTYSKIAAFASAQFGLSIPYGKVLGFVLMWALTEYIYPKIGYVILKKIHPHIKLGVWNRVLGPIPAVFEGLLIMSFVFTFALTLPFSSSLKAAIVHSPTGGLAVGLTRSVESAIDLVFGNAVVDSISLMTTQEHSEEHYPLHFTTTIYNEREDLEIIMIGLMNEERRKLGLRDLVMDDTIVPVARAHSADMLKGGYFSHVSLDGKTPSERADVLDVLYLAFGENLAFSQNIHAAHAGLMDSPGHRKNILNPIFGRIGIGVLDAGYQGLMITQNFAN